MVDILSSPSNQSEQALKISGPIFISAVKSLNSYCVWFPTKPRQGLCWLRGLSQCGGHPGDTPLPWKAAPATPAARGAGAAGRENPNKCKGQSRRSVPCAGVFGNGRGSSFSLLDLLLQPPFPVLLAPVPSACGQLPLSLPWPLQVWNGFAISLSISVNIVPAGCPDQRNSLKGPWPVVLWLTTKSLFCPVLPTLCLPTHPSVHPPSLVVGEVGTGKELKPPRWSPKGSPSSQLSFSQGLAATSGYRKFQRQIPAWPSKRMHRRRAPTCVSLEAKDVRCEEERASSTSLVPVVASLGCTAAGIKSKQDAVVAQCGWTGSAQSAPKTLQNREP